MRVRLLGQIAAGLLLVGAADSAAQAPPPDFRAEFLGQFNASAEKLVALANAGPADRYAWRPGEGVASIAQAYMHIARYNYMYPQTSLGVALPEGIDYSRWEEDVTEKAAVVPILEQSMAHVRALATAMTDADLARMNRLYGRDVPQWAVLLQLITHMNEHLGQEIAYARMNGVVPPWSR
jgi:uncharacterized damage-inducible protein DinB